MYYFMVECTIEMLWVSDEINRCINVIMQRWNFTLKIYRHIAFIDIYQRYTLIYQSISISKTTESKEIVKDVIGNNCPQEEN